MSSPPLSTNRPRKRRVDDLYDNELSAVSGRTPVSPSYLDLTTVEVACGTSSTAEGDCAENLKSKLLGLHDSLASELSRPLPAPWKEERVARGLNLKGFQNLRVFLAAPLSSDEPQGGARAENAHFEEVDTSREQAHAEPQSPQANQIPVSNSPYDRFAQTIAKMTNPHRTRELLHYLAHMQQLRGPTHVAQAMPLTVVPVETVYVAQTPIQSAPLASVSECPVATPISYQVIRQPMPACTTTSTNPTSFSRTPVMPFMTSTSDSHIQRMPGGTNDGSTGPVRGSVQAQASKETRNTPLQPAPSPTSLMILPPETASHMPSRTSGPGRSSLNEAGGAATENSATLPASISAARDSGQDGTASCSVMSLSVEASHKIAAPPLSNKAPPSMDSGKENPSSTSNPEAGVVYSSSSNEVQPTQNEARIQKQPGPPKPVKPPSKKPATALAIDPIQFSELLNHCRAAGPTDIAPTIAKLKEVAKGDVGIARVQNLTREVVKSLHTAFVEHMRAEGKELLEIELWAQWLKECLGFATTLNRLMHACHPGARVRIGGVGRVGFAIVSALFNFQKPGGILDVTWDLPSSSAECALPPRILRPPAPSEAKSAPESAEVARREILRVLGLFDDEIAKVITRYRSESQTGMGHPMRACEKRLGTAVAALARRIEMPGLGGEVGSGRASTNTLPYCRKAMALWAESASAKAGKV